MWQGRQLHKSRALRVTAACLLLTCVCVPFFLSNLVEDESEGASPSASAAFCSAAPPLIYAHGGDTANGVFPSNSQAAIRAAAALQMEGIEIDVSRTSDRVFVVLHNRDLQILMGKNWRKGMQVGDLAWSELSDANYRGDPRFPVLTVNEAIRLASPFFASVILDIKTYESSSSSSKGGKDDDPLELADAIMRLVHNTSCDNCLIWAKSDAVVKAIKANSPGQRIGYILMNETAAAREAGMPLPLRMQGEVVGCHHAMVESSLHDLLHAHGRQLYAWTVNDADDLSRVLAVGVDAIVTNKPSETADAIQARLNKCGRMWADDDDL